MSTKPSSRRRDKDDTTNPDVLLPGIGNYVFQKTVGEGNFAKVKLAQHKLTGQEVLIFNKVAIKIIDKTTLDEKKISKLYREVRIMKMLHHPNIVKLYEVIETKSTVFLVMEYASGGELYDYLVVHGKMKEKEARAKFRQILSAVSYCHKKRVIHRDLKAENLLLDANFNVKIADFGFSNHFDPDSKLDTFCGSPPYAAPELFQGRKYTGPEVDVWSLGVILYVLTTGCLPFDGKNLQEMRESVCRGKYRIPFFLSDNCEKLLKKFLVRDPARRASLEILVDDPWVNESYDQSPILTDISTSVAEDETIIRYIEQKHKLDRESILQAIRENIYNDVSAIYYMMFFEKQAKEMNGEKVELPPLDTSDITRLDTPKKESISSPTQVPTNLMPVIDEDGVLPEAVVPMSKPEDAKSGEVQSAAVSKPPVVVARRRRAATVTGDGGKEESPFQPAVPIHQTPHIPQVRPATATANATTPVLQNAEQEKPTTAGSVPEQRKRTNTIVGIFRGVGSGKKDDEDANSTHGPEDADKPRSLRFTFNSSSTSSKPPDEIMVELARCCNKLSVQHKLITRYLMECSPPQTGKEPLKMEIEVCKLPRLNNLHGLRFKRVSGSSSEYKDLCEKVLTTVQL